MDTVQWDNKKKNTVKLAEMAKILLDKYEIFTEAIDGGGVQGCRITPKVYTNTNE